MTSIRKLSVALFVSTLALTATAQDRPAGSAASPTPSTTTAQDCAEPMARHDHGAEKGMPMAKSKSVSGPCAPAAAASAPKEKAKPRHDHAKFHNNQ